VASRFRPRFDPLQLIETLQRHDVAYVVVGGVGARLHGAPHQTRDLDVAARQDEPNLERLAAALNELGPMKIDPRFRTPHPHTVTSAELRDEPVASYVTRFGRVDVLHELGPERGYEVLASTSERFDLGGGLEVRAASLDEIIAAKERLGREKDKAQLPSLYAARDELAARPSGSGRDVDGRDEGPDEGLDEGC